VVTEFSTRLREARITLLSAWPNLDQAVVLSLWGPQPLSVTGTVSPIDYRAYPAYQPVKSAGEARGQNLAMPVLATQSGGGVLNGVGDVAGLIGENIDNANAFYTLEFDPPNANQVDEYHDLKVEVGKPDLKVHTNTGYYDEPSYRDQPAGARRVTVEQLEQMLGMAHGSGDKEVAEELSGLELTERMRSMRLSSWEAQLPGKRSRAALVGLADRSVFLDLPTADIPATAPPDPTARRLMLSRVVEYLSKTLAKLPNFFATRTTIQYDEPPPKDEQAWKTVAIDQSLHVTKTSKTTVLFRDGKEVADADARKGKRLNARDRNLNTQGTFGPILAVVFSGASATGSEFAWSHWEKGASGPQAVFGYAVPQHTSVFDVGFCCLADPNRTIVFKVRAGYHGEIAIDPASGAVRRLTVEADLAPKLLMVSSGIMVEYGPVAIGGNSYICPTRSVSISRQRTVTIGNEWGERIGVYGRFETILNDVAFEEYHIFRSKSRILTGAPPAPKHK
jgi:hypothetical protein